MRVYVLTSEDDDYNASTCVSGVYACLADAMAAPGALDREWREQDGYDPPQWWARTAPATGEYTATRWTISERELHGADVPTNNVSVTSGNA